MIWECFFKRHILFQMRDDTGFNLQIAEIVMKKQISFLLLALILTVVALPLVSAADDAPTPPPVSDPSGASIGGTADVIGATAGAPTKEDLDTLSAKEPLAAKLADVVGHNRISINMVWTLVCGFLVMFMQAGFAMAETGFTRAKNAGHTMTWVRLTPCPSSTNFFSAAGAWTSSTSTSQFLPCSSALPVPTATHFRSMPVSFLKASANTGSNPVSSVLVVVAIINVWSLAKAGVAVSRARASPITRHLKNFARIISSCGLLNKT